MSHTASQCPVHNTCHLTSLSHIHLSEFFVRDLCPRSLSEFFVGCPSFENELGYFPWRRSRDGSGIPCHAFSVRQIGQNVGPLLTSATGRRHCVFVLHVAGAEVVARLFWWASGGCSSDLSVSPFVSCTWPSSSLSRKPASGEGSPPS